MQVTDVLYIPSEKKEILKSTLTWLRNRGNSKCYYKEFFYFEYLLPPFELLYKFPKLSILLAFITRVH